jgi:hypothetical protein
LSHSPHLLHRPQLLHPTREKSLRWIPILISIPLRSAVESIRAVIMQEGTGQVRSGQEGQTRANRGPRIGIGASLQKERDTGKLTTEGSAMKRLPARLQVMSVEVAVIDENLVRGVDISPCRDQILKQVCSISNCPIEGSGTMLPHSEILCR